MKLNDTSGTIVTDDSNCSSDSSYDLTKDHNTSENFVYIDKLNKLILSDDTENDIFAGILNDKFVHEVQNTDESSSISSMSTEDLLENGEDINGDETSISNISEISSENNNSVSSVLFIF